MDNINIIRKVALAVFKDKKMLCVRSHKQPEVFYSLGGKLEAGESDEECLRREVQEEVGCEIDTASLKFLYKFEGPAHGKENTLLIIRLYEGDLIGEPIPSSEIVEVKYLDSSDTKHLSEIAKSDIIPWLVRKGYIN